MLVLCVEIFVEKYRKRLVAIAELASHQFASDLGLGAFDASESMSRFVLPCIARSTKPV